MRLCILTINLCLELVRLYEKFVLKNPCFVDYAASGLIVFA